MLQINDKLRIIKPDKNNIVIEELRLVTSKKNGTREEWCWCGYFGSVKAALTAALDKITFDSLEQELEIKDLIKIIDNAKQTIVNAIGNKEE